MGKKDEPRKAIGLIGWVDPKLVHKSVPDDGEITDTPQSESRPTQITESPERTTSNMAQNESSGASLIRKSLNRYDLSSTAQEILMASWRSGTTKQYRTYLNKRKNYCFKHEVDLSNPDLKHPIEFLVSLYKSLIYDGEYICL